MWINFTNSGTCTCSKMWKQRHLILLISVYMHLFVPKIVPFCRGPFSPRELSEGHRHANVWKCFFKIGNWQTNKNNNNYNRLWGSLVKSISTWYFSLSAFPVSIFFTDCFSWYLLFTNSNIFFKSTSVM